MLDHVAIQAADVDAAARFYLTTFASLGFHELMRFQLDKGLVVGLAGADGFPRFWLGPLVDQGQREVHIAFSAASRDVVNQVHERRCRRRRRDLCTLRASGRNTTRAITGCSSATWTATTWRRSSTGTLPDRRTPAPRPVGGGRRL